MKRLSRTQEGEKAEHAKAVGEKKAALEQAISEYNSKCEEAQGPVTAALEDLNNAIEAANNWRADIAQAQEDYHGERSEKWQESEAGQNYDEWKSGWSNEFDQVEMEFPDALQVPDCEVDDNLDGLASEPGGF